MQRLGPEVVVDTSVAVKFFFEEEDADKALLLLDAFQAGSLRFIVLDFLTLEFVNVLWQKSLGGELTEEEAEQVLAKFQALASQTEIVPVNAMLPATLQACRIYNHAAYDVAFLVMAETRGIPLVTADRRFYKKVSARSRAAMLLSDLRV